MLKKIKRDKNKSTNQYIMETKDLHYLISDAFKARYVMAAHCLRNCKNILEIGGYKTPITHFLTGNHDSVTVVDPYTESFSADTLNGKPCKVNHVKKKIEEYDYPHNIDGFLFLGMACISKDTLVPIMKKCKLSIIEYPPGFLMSSFIFTKILETRLFEVKNRIIFDLSENNFGDLSNSWEPFLTRHLYVLETRENLNSKSKELNRWITINKSYLKYGDIKTGKPTFIGSIIRYLGTVMKKHIPALYHMLVTN